MDEKYEIIAFRAFMEHIQKELRYAMDHHWPKELIIEKGFDEAYIRSKIDEIEFLMSDAIIDLKDVEYHTE